MDSILPRVYPVTSHTDHVGPNSTFVAVSGYVEHGACYIDQAIHRGATRIIVDFTTPIEGLQKRYPSTIFEQVVNPRRELAVRSAAAWGNPAQKLTIIGITGTKGKTTTSHLIHHMLREAGYKAALLGTIENCIGDSVMPASLTTMASDDLHAFFAACVREGVTHVVMEVSAHALSLERVHGVLFQVVGFTNLASEHMDFYSSLEEYFEAKARIVDLLTDIGVAVVNIDDAWGRRVVSRVSWPRRMQPISASTWESMINSPQDGIALRIDGYVMSLPPLFGAFNEYNVAMAWHAARAVGCVPDAIQRASVTFSGVPGRLEKIVLPNNVYAYIDFAHNVSSVEAVLRTLRTHTKQLIVVIGCGGDRDRSKRSLMAQLAVQYGDLAIFTEDNPRFEDPRRIFDDMTAELSSRARDKVRIIRDRKKAIKHAIDHGKCGAIIAILGKGHECGQQVKGEVIPLSDREEVLKYAVLTDKSRRSTLQN